MLIRTVFSIMFLVIMLPFVFLRDAIEIPYISRDMLLIFAVVSVNAGSGELISYRLNICVNLYIILAQRFKST